MVDVVGLARHIRTEFPTPNNYAPIFVEMTKQLGEEPSEEIQRDVYTALVRLWTRNHWAFDNEVGAVLLKDGEDVLFDENAITVSSGKGGSVMVWSLARGEKHDRVKWF